MTKKTNEYGYCFACKRSFEPEKFSRGAYAIARDKLKEEKAEFLSLLKECLAGWRKWVKDVGSACVDVYEDEKRIKEIRKKISKAE